eukprot:TRINITY_DN5354_c1_g1_i1.p1 TRINITY_DN5354_c1_g1~~TRINITY_DN5354_c1_g1_i1.p1  ORF type:complete len:355 (+),score=92.51 TRINITY_DN5354_c1_g1_i1:49-1113(+)
MAAAGGHHTLLLRSDGQALVFGKNNHRQSETPPDPPAGRRYTGVTAGYRHSVLLRDDGVVLWQGQGKSNWCPVPGIQADDRMIYLEASPGARHIALLSDDGQVVLCGSNSDGQSALEKLDPKPDDLCGVLDLPAGVRFAKVIAGQYHTIAIQDDGVAVAIGDNNWGQCEVPELPAGIRYIDGAAGVFHSLLIRDDGQAVAFGDNREGQLQVPELSLGSCYVDVAAGDYHSVLLRDDGEAFVFGANKFGQCIVPTLPEGTKYGNLVVVVSAVMTVGEIRSTGDLLVTVEDRHTGEELLTWQLDPELDTSTVGDLRAALAKKVGRPKWSLRLFEGKKNKLLPFIDDSATVLSVFNV